MFEQEEAKKTEEESKEKNKVTKNEDGSFSLNGKHYKDVDALLEAKIKADEHIDIIQGENKALFEQNRSLAAQAELIQSLQNRLDTWSKPQEQPKQQQQQQEGEFHQRQQQSQQPSRPALDPQYTKLQDEVEGLKKTLSQGTRAAQEEKIKTQLVAELGKEGAIRAWNQFKSSSEFEESQYVQDVLKRPNTVFAAIKGFASQAQSGYTPSGGNRPGNQGGSQGAKPWSHYKQLMLTDPKRYKTPEIARQMRADKAALGDRFMST